MSYKDIYARYAGIPILGSVIGLMVVGAEALKVEQDTEEVTQGLKDTEEVTQGLKDTLELMKKANDLNSNYTVDADEIN